MIETAFFTLRLLINIVSYDTNPETISNHIWENNTNKIKEENKNAD